jgi:hypothetical protein
MNFLELFAESARACPLRAQPSGIEGEAIQLKNQKSGFARRECLTRDAPLRASQIGRVSYRSIGMTSNRPSSEVSELIA